MLDPDEKWIALEREIDDPSEVFKRNRTHRGKVSAITQSSLGEPRKPALGDSTQAAPPAKVNLKSKLSPKLQRKLDSDLKALEERCRKRGWLI